MHPNSHTTAAYYLTMATEHSTDPPTLEQTLESVSIATETASNTQDTASTSSKPKAEKRVANASTLEGTFSIPSFSPL